MMDNARTLKKEREWTQEKVEAIDLMLRHINEVDFECTISAGNMAITVNSLEGVDKAKRFCHNALGVRWAFSEVQRFAYTNTSTITAWGARASAWRIWLDVEISEYPAELIPEGCGWQKESEKRVTPQFVCAVNK